MNLVPLVAVAGTAVVFKDSWTAEGRINNVKTNFDTINERNNDFLEKALPTLLKTHADDSICRGTKKTTRLLNNAALRKNELVGALANKPFWTRLSPWFKSAEIREIERRLAQLNDTTMMTTSKAYVLMEELGCDSDSDDESYYEASEEEPVLSDSPSSGGVDIYRDSRREPADGVDDSSEGPLVQAGLRRTSSTSTIRRAVVD